MNSVPQLLLGKDAVCRCEQPQHQLQIHIYRNAGLVVIGQHLMVEISAWQHCCPKPRSSANQ